MNDRHLSFGVWLFNPKRIWAEGLIDIWWISYKKIADL